MVSSCSCSCSFRSLFWRRSREQATSASWVVLCSLNSSVVNCSEWCHGETAEKWSLSLAVCLLVQCWKCTTKIHWSNLENGQTRVGQMSKVRTFLLAHSLNAFLYVGRLSFVTEHTRAAHRPCRDGVHCRGSHTYSMTEKRAELLSAETNQCYDCG